MLILSAGHGEFSRCGWRRPRVMIVAVNRRVLNKLSWTDAKERSFSFGVGRGLTTLQCEIVCVTKLLQIPRN